MEKEMTLSQAVQQVIDELDGTISEDELAGRVFELYSTTAKTARSSLRNTLRYEHDGKSIILISKDKIIPMRLFMPGIQFRIPVDARLAHACVLTSDMFEPFYVYSREGEKSFTFVDKKGAALPVQMKSVVPSAPKELGFFWGERKVNGYNLQKWAAENRMQKGDSILVTIRDWEKGVYALEHEPAARRRRRDIEKADQQFAEALFAILEASSDERPFAFQVILKALYTLPDPYGYPGNPWTQVIEKDGRMNYDGVKITYAEDLGLFERMVMRDSDERLPYIKDKYTKAQSNEVFCFKAEVGFNKRIWRKVEIKGGQELADLDRILRTAFQLDPSDHLGGFWKLVPRGTSKRVREVDIGSVDPMGGGSAADLHIGGLELKPGDRLKYVYDFGDWIEHFLTLEEITTVTEGTEYPRIVGQNKPRYRYCQDCAEEGKKTIATIICIDCSNQKKEDVLACEECLGKKHQDHDYVEILY